MVEFESTGVLDHGALHEGMMLRLAELHSYMTAEVEKLGVHLKELHGENEKLKAVGLRSVGCPTKALISESGKLAQLQPDAPLVTPREVATLQDYISGDTSEKSLESALQKTQVSVVWSLRALRRAWRLAGFNEPMYKDEGWYISSSFFAKVARSAWFESLTLFVIVLNAAWIGIELDVTRDDERWIFLLVDNLFCLFFSFELVIRFRAFRKTSFAISDAWFLYDLLLLMIMILETWIIPVFLLLAARRGFSKNGGALALRLLRLLRLTRMVRGMRMVPELRTIVRGMIAALRSVGIALTLLLGITYVFAIIFRQLANDTEIGDIHFSSIPMSCYSLLIQGMLPDQAMMMKQLSEEDWLLGLVFFLFIFVAPLTIMNLLIGIMCDVVRHVAESQKEHTELQAMTMKIEDMLRSNDPSFDGAISKSGFGKFMSSANTMKSLNDAGVDVLALIDDVEGMFDQLPGLRLSVEEFAEVVGQFQANHGATTRSIAGLRKIVRTQTEKIMQSMAEMTGMMKDLRDPTSSTRSPRSEQLYSLRQSTKKIAMTRTCGRGSHAELI
mmetsp:Transcript_22505/g.49704  ORF Transcript_22505/g.49704 Transcript_22505/m.49704 type:complete len:557 (+) Transcript_22505:38-1708(+)